MMAENGEAQLLLRLIPRPKRQLPDFIPKQAKAPMEFEPKEEGPHLESHVPSEDRSCYGAPGRIVGNV